MRRGTVPPSFDHLCIVVSDVERAVAWHERVLGATREGRGCTSIGGASFRLVEVAAGTGERSALRADEVGACHVCVAVPDVQAAYERIRAGHVPTSTPPVELLPGLWSVYFTDPDGIRYQFLQRGDAPALHHFAYSVSDLDRTLAWYDRVFGIAPAYRGESSGDLVSRTLEVEAGAYRVALVPVGGVQLELMEWRSPGAAADRVPAGAVGDWRLGLACDAAAEPGQELLDPDGLRIQLVVCPTPD